MVIGLVDDIAEELGVYFEEKEGYKLGVGELSNVVQFGGLPDAVTFSIEPY